MSRKSTPAAVALAATAAAPAPTAAAELPAPAAPAGGEENATTQAIEGSSTADKANTAAPVSEVVSATTALSDATAAPEAAGSAPVAKSAPAEVAASAAVESGADPVPTTAYRVVGLDLMIDGKLIPENSTVELDYEPSAKTLRRLEPVTTKEEGNQ